MNKFALVVIVMTISCVVYIEGKKGKLTKTKESYELLGRIIVLIIRVI